MQRFTNPVFETAKHYALKILVAQDTGQVIWLTKVTGPIDYIPKIGIGLDYISFVGTSNIALVEEYRQGRLAWNNNKFELHDFPAAVMEQALVLRMKCVSLKYVDHRINTLSENFLELQKIYQAFKFGNQQDSKLVKTISNIHNISSEDAHRFIQFKVDEHENIVSELELIRYKHTQALKQTKTLEQVFDAYRQVAIQLMQLPGIAERDINDMKTKFSALGEQS